MSRTVFQPFSHRAGYLHPHACLQCRKSFKRKLVPEQRYLGPVPAKLCRCPQCSGPVVALARKFKPPSSDDLKQWAKVRYLIERGYFFQSVSGKYPATLKDAPAFVLRHDTLAEKRRRQKARAVAEKSGSKSATARAPLKKGSAPKPPKTP